MFYDLILSAAFYNSTLVTATKSKHMLQQRKTIHRPVELTSKSFKPIFKNEMLRSASFFGFKRGIPQLLFNSSSYIDAEVA